MDRNHRLRIILLRQLSKMPKPYRLIILTIVARAYFERLNLPEPEENEIKNQLKHWISTKLIKMKWTGAEWTYEII